MIDDSMKKKVRSLMLLAAALLVCDVLLVYLTPAMTILGAEHVTEGAAGYLSKLFRPGEDDIVMAGVFGTLAAWVWIWGQGVVLVRAAALVGLGGSVAFVLVQGIRLLGNLEEGALFSPENVRLLRRAAWGSFVGAAAALVRLAWNAAGRGLRAEDAFLPLVLVGAGLLSLIFSALFRQAHDLKSENDLTV